MKAFLPAAIMPNDRMLACTRVVICGVMFMITMAAFLWQRDVVAVKLSLLEAHLPTLRGGQMPLDHTKQRFWTSEDHEISGLRQWNRPDGIKKVMALVFYGRRQSVSILDCYLKRNLVKNGGMLDGVIFVQRTRDALDRKLLDELLQSESTYEKWIIDMNGADNFASGFGNSYDQIEDDVLYVKIDDDIVYIEDSVIPYIIQKKVQHPEYFVVSANIVNQPLLSWVHWNLGAIKPYLPELDNNGKSERILIDDWEKYDWRVSGLPPWSGPDKFKIEKWKSSEMHHRWLPVPGVDHHILDRTPIERTEYDAMGRGWLEWTIGAQEHYSLFENLENNNMSKYKFDNWDFQYRRMGIQFIAMMGKDINAAKPIGRDDEQHFSCTMPQKLGRHAVADGRGVAAHYSFGSQKGGMDRTDILDRYRTFARDNICASPMIWTPNDP